MSALPAKVLPQTASFRDSKPSRSEGYEPHSYSELLQAFEDLQSQYQRCAGALAAAAHDLRTPLAIVSGYIELLLSGKVGPLSEQQRTITEDIRSNTARLADLISNFLTFSALETGKLGMRFELGDLNASLSELCNLWLPRFQQKKIAFYFLLSDQITSLVFDQLRVQRVVTNLLENAFKYTPAGGTVWLASEPYLLDRRSSRKEVTNDRRRTFASTANGVRVVVADTGPGIAAEFHQEIFNDFFHMANSQDGPEGMGLGLAICRRLIHAHGGKIWVESERGAGSKFCFFLPLTPEDGD